MDDKVNILIVDDLPEKLVALEVVLQDLCENIVQARSGREALRRLLEQDFAVILLDVNMPDMDGLETAQLIRQRPRSTHTPIIFITAFGDELQAAQGYQLGAVDFILSPVIPHVLRTKVSVFVDLFRMHEQVKRRAEEQVSLARAQAARAAAEEVTRRSLFLAEASTALANSLDLEATTRGLLRLLVPYLADLGAVTMAPNVGSAWRTELAWLSGPAAVLQDRQLAAAEKVEGEPWAAVERVLAGGTSEVLSKLGAAFPEGGNAAPRRLETAVVLPLLARGHTLGALTLGRAGDGARNASFTPAELALAGDVAGRAAIALDNARLYRDIQESDRHKNEFLAMLAHELRNPLAPIRNAVHLLHMTGADDPTQTWARGVIQRQVQQMVRLVDDLLDVSRITRGKITLRTEDVDVATVVNGAVETSRPLIDSRRHELIVTLPEAPLRAKADPARLAQVLANVLNNAAKYTEEGGRIWLTVGREGDEAVFRIRDTGVGIPPEMLARVFELFTQVDRSLDRSQGGLGIGLSLVRRIVELHGGRVEASSAGPGKGSEFVVRLPAAADEPAAAPRIGVNGTATQSAAYRTLVVDDNVDGAESLAALLRVDGHEVRTAHDGPAALAAAAAFRPEVVLLDIGLPRLDGYEVARRLRGTPELEGIHLVSLTGYGEAEDRRRALDAGFDEHLVKPVSAETVQELFASFRPRNGTGAHEPRKEPRTQ